MTYIDMVRLCNMAAWEIADRRQEKMSDLISRQAVLMSLTDYQLQESPNWGANGMGNTDAYESITECIRVIEQAPTIDPVKRGKWIVIPQRCENQTFDECKCSVCGTVEYFNSGWEKFNYCPNCGADMRGE